MERNISLSSLLILLVSGCNTSTPIGERWTREFERTYAVRAATDAEVPEIISIFTKVQIGMSRQEAEAILGKPNRSSQVYCEYLPSAPPKPPESPYAPWGIQIRYKKGKVAQKTLNPQFRHPEQSPAGDVPKAAPEE